MRHVTCFLITSVLAVACGSDRSPIPEPFDLVNGEAPIAVHCLERTIQAQERRRTPWKAWGCDRDSLHQLSLKEPPASLVLIPECGNRLLHITSDDYVTTKVIPLDGQDRFETTLAIEDLTLTDGRGWACPKTFRVFLHGRVECPSANIVVETSWVEAPSGARGCPSTWPCQFKTAARIVCSGA